MLKVLCFNLIILVTALFPACSTSTVSSPQDVPAGDDSVMVDGSSRTGDVVSGDLTGDDAATTDISSPDLVQDNQSLDLPADVSLEEFLEAHEISVLAEQGDREVGKGTTDAKGHASFYSYKHNAVVEFYALDDEKNPLGEMDVSLHLFDDATGMAFVFDPTGQRAPGMYTGEFGDGTITVDSEDELDDLVDFDEGGPNPFPGKQFSLLSLSWSSVLSFTMRAAVTSAISYVVKKWVKELCLFARPLHAEACSIASMVAGLVTGVVMGGVQMGLKEGLTWTGLGQVVVDELIDFGCGDVLGALLTAWGPVEGLTGNGALKDEVQLLFKKAAWKYNYMMSLSDSVDNPPDGAQWGAIQPLLVKGIQALAVQRPLVLKDYFIALPNQKTFVEDQLSANNLFKFSSGLVKEAVTEHIFTVTSFIDLQTILLDIDMFYYQTIDGLVVETTMTVEHFHYQRVEGEWSTKNLPDGKVFKCGLAAFTALTGYVQDAAGNTLQSWGQKSILEAVRDQLTLLNLQADAMHKLGWGEDIVVPDCLPDLLEPNDVWQNAPSVANLGSAVTVEDMLLLPGDVD